VQRIIRVLSVSVLASFACNLVASQSEVSPASAATASSTYLVLYKQTAVPADVSASIASAGGSLVQAYDEIGVAIATSSNGRFREQLTRDSRVQDAGTTAPAGIRLKLPRLPASDVGATAAPLADTADTTDDLTDKQWDMRQMHAFEAHALTYGNQSVLVGDIDTGVDYKHPDLKPNIDFGNSVSCIGGRPDRSPPAWADGLGHGTHTAGTIAAAGTGLGIRGVAPNVRIAAIKAGDDNGIFLPEAVVCAFIWAATHHVNVANNSYFADPYYFNCPNDPLQNFILIAEQRAISFAQSRGVMVVASLDNFSDDLANPTQDRHSPTNGTPAPRAVDRSCRVLPAQAPGVIGVSSTGNQGLKGASSNYGLGVVDIAAPGGDSRLQPAPTADGSGRVLSTWPASLFDACPPSRRETRPTNDPDEPLAVYCYQQGTSMAAAHVSGVAALMLSGWVNHDESRARWTDSQDTLRSLLYASAQPTACPSADVLALYAAFPAVDNDAPQRCQGDATYNSWYGHGQVNALAAVRAAERNSNRND
jgi:subtilisin family serine protease